MNVANLTPFPTSNIVIMLLHTKPTTFSEKLYIWKCILVFCNETRRKVVVHKI